MRAKGEVEIWESQYFLLRGEPGRVTIKPLRESTRIKRRNRPRKEVRKKIGGNIFG